MALFRIDYRGTIYGIETFQHGHHVSSADTANGVAGDAAGAWATVLGTAAANTYYPTTVVWSQVNVSELGGTPAAPITTSAQANINLAGVSSDNGLSPQCSPCLSLTTSTAGSRARGRMFLPPPDISALTTAGRLIAGFRTAWIAALDTYFDTMVVSGHAPVVVSSVGGVYTTYGVNTIRLGDVIDTQRSRRNDIAEVYTTASV